MALFLFIFKTRFPVRFIRDVFVENYDPTIEGELTLSRKPLPVKWFQDKISEEYRRTVTLDGILSSVRLERWFGRRPFSSMQPRVSLFFKCWHLVLYTPYNFPGIKSVGHFPSFLSDRHEFNRLNLCFFGVLKFVFLCSSKFWIRLEPNNSRPSMKYISRFDARGPPYACVC